MVMGKQNSHFAKHKKNWVTTIHHISELTKKNELKTWKCIPKNEMHQRKNRSGHDIWSK